MRYLPFAVGIVEVVVFVAVASWIGVGWTILLALLTSVLGFLAFQREGMRAWASLRDSVAAGSAVEQEEVRRRLAGTGSRMVASFLLMLPGFLTDALGALLLVPAVRTGVGQRVAFSALRTFPTRGGNAAGYGMSGTPGQGAPGQGAPGQGAPGQRAPGQGPTQGPAGRSGNDPSNVVIEGEVVDGRQDDPDGT